MSGIRKEFDSQFMIERDIKVFLEDNGIMCSFFSHTIPGTALLFNGKNGRMLILETTRDGETTFISAVEIDKSPRVDLGTFSEVSAITLEKGEETTKVTVEGTRSKHFRGEGAFQFEV